MTAPKPTTRKVNVEPPIKNLPHGGAANLTWLHDGACTDADPTLFFPETVGDHSSHVKQVVADYCNHCPVKQRCHQYAVDIGASAGIFGGEEFISTAARYARRHRAKYRA